MNWLLITLGNSNGLQERTFWNSRGPGWQQSKEKIDFLEDEPLLLFLKVSAEGVSKANSKKMILKDIGISEEERGSNLDSLS